MTINRTVPSFLVADQLPLDRELKELLKPNNIRRSPKQSQTNSR
jgi:hypothetical protein